MRPLWMARITGEAVIGVSLDVLVFVVHCDLRVFMTIQAVEDRVIG